MDLINGIRCCFLALLIVCSMPRNLAGPELSFHPMPVSANGSPTSLIWYKGSEPESINQMVKSLSSFLAPYKAPGFLPGQGKNIYNCNYNQPPPKGKACEVNIRSFGPCVEENNFSYHKSSPCVFLKTENEKGWLPEYYNSSQDLPEAMPTALKTHIKELEQKSKEKLNTVWVSCGGLSPLDIELLGPLSYVDQPGFPGYFFQLETPEDYLSPLMAVKFDHPTRGVVVFVECKLWARNIVHDPVTRSGSVHFQLLVD